MPKSKFYFAELTDMYGGEANYSWVTRFIIEAKTERGAINKLSKEIGLSYRFDVSKYISRSGCTCYFIEYCDNPEETFNQYDSLYNRVKRI